MHDDDAPMATASQDAWVELAAAVRDHLRRRLPDMAAMDPGELGEFVAAARDAYFLELNAATYDEVLAAESRRLTIG